MKKYNSKLNYKGGMYKNLQMPKEEKLKMKIQEKKFKEILADFIKNTINLDLIDLDVVNIEKLNRITEYDFYIIDLIVKLKNSKTKSIFIKLSKKGKIKESLFCICNLFYEKENNMDKLNKAFRKITILEENVNKNINMVSVDISNQNAENKINLKIYFIEVEKFLNNKIKKRWEDFFEINQIMIIGIVNRY